MFKIICVMLLASSPWLGVRAENLTLEEALELAERQSPDIAAQTAAVAAARSSSIAAGRLPNPRLRLGLDDIPVSDRSRSGEGRPKNVEQIGIKQAIPNGALRASQVEVAAAAVARANAEERVQRLNVRLGAASAWLQRYYLERRVGLLDELDAENRLFAASVEAQLAGGGGLPADAIAPALEAAELADRRDVLLAEIAQSRAVLRRWLGALGDAPLSDAAPAFDIDPAQLIADLPEQPELQAFVPLLAQAQAEVREAAALRRPDWELEVTYGRRDAAIGDILAAQVTIGLPLFQGTRIEPTIVAKREAVNRIVALREAKQRELGERLDSQLAAHLAVSRQVARTRAVKVPLAQRKVDLQLASYQANSADLNAVLDARRELIDARLRLIELEGAQAVLAAQLYFTFGEGAP